MLAEVMTNRFPRAITWEGRSNAQGATSMTTTFTSMFHQGTTGFGARARIAFFAADALGVRVLSAPIGAVPGSSAPTTWRPRT